MKQFRPFFFFFVSLAAMACNNNADNEALQKKAAKDTANFTTVLWLDTLQSIGTINMGEKVEVRFRCKNTGTKPLVITSAKPSCGCTVADYTKEPIAPNGEGLVTAAFDSKKIKGSGDVHKTIIVNTNTKNDAEKYLVFTGFVKNAPGDKVVVPKEEKKK